LSPDKPVDDGTHAFVSDVSDGARPLKADVRAGMQHVIQVFITHSASVFLVDNPPVVHATATGREGTGEHLLRLEEQVLVSV